MKTIRIQLCADRYDTDVLAYMGYRHVNGVMAWDAEEKAAFIASLVENKHVRWSYGDIARRLGSKAPYIEKLYVAHRLIEQARENDVPGHEIMRKQFGVLTRALQSPGIVKFLGITFPKDPAKSRLPSTAPTKSLQDFVMWTFGTDDEKPVLEDSRDLTKWGQTLASPESLRYLRTAPDPRFARAYAKSGGEKEGLLDGLMAASDHLADAIPLIRSHKDNAEVRRAVTRCTDYIAQILVHFPDVAEAQGLALSNASTT